MTTEPRSLALPTDNSGPDWLDWVARRGDDELARCRTLVDELKASPPTEAVDALRVWNDAQVALSNAASVASFFAEVHPDKAVRDRAEMVAQEVQKLDTDLGLDRELYAVFAALDAASLDAAAARLLERTLRDFRRSGVDRDEATRARLRELSEKGLLLSQDFSKNIRENVRSIRVRPEQLDGMPPDWIDAHPPGDDGLVTVTTDYPDVVPFRTFAKDATARRDLVTQFLTIGWPANDQVLQDIFAVRRETASLLGYDSWADYDAEVKMIGKGKAIAEFIDRITDLSADSAARD
ncbi:MAG TPA: peptidase M3, partial [Intrasporangium sp.]|nr:peptidase M3 [Intrasporangium sp.]